MPKPKQLSNDDIENMIGPGAVLIDIKAVRKRIKPKPPVLARPQNYMDCHGKTTEEAWQEILGVIYANAPTPFKFRIISGRSGVLRGDVEKWLTRGTLSYFVRNFELENPGSFLVTFKHPKSHEIIQTNTKGYKIKPIE